MTFDDFLFPYSYANAYYCINKCQSMVNKYTLMLCVTSSRSGSSSSSDMISIITSSSKSSIINLHLKKKKERK